jgi:hypothetical protein
MGEATHASAHHRDIENRQDEISGTFDGTAFPDPPMNLM